MTAASAAGTHRARLGLLGALVGAGVQRGGECRALLRPAGRRAPSVVAARRRRGRRGVLAGRAAGRDRGAGPRQLAGRWPVADGPLRRAGPGRGGRRGRLVPAPVRAAGFLRRGRDHLDGGAAGGGRADGDGHRRAAGHAPRRRRRAPRRPRRPRPHRSRPRTRRAGHADTPRRVRPTVRPDIGRADRRTPRVDTAARVAALRSAHPDMATADIAARLGVSDRTVRRHLARHLAHDATTTDDAEEVPA